MTRIYFDVLIVIITIAVSWIALGNVVGVREGTVLMAVFLGACVNFFLKLFSNRKADLVVKKQRSN